MSDKVMLVLRGIRGTFGGVVYPVGAIDVDSADSYASALGYDSRFIDASVGYPGPNTEQVRNALAAFREDVNVRALYGFSGGGYNVRHVLNALDPKERERIERVVVLGAPEAPERLFKAELYKGGAWELVYRLDPKEGHMAGPRVLLAEEMSKQRSEGTA